MLLDQPIHAWVIREKQAIIDCLRYFIGIDTQNLAPKGNERAGQLAMAALLNVMGCTVDVYDIKSVPGLQQNSHYWSERPATGRPNVMGIRHGRGGGRSLLFSGHMDTVPAGMDTWHHLPWEGEIADGKLFGLGAYDMKSGLVASLMVVRALNELGWVLNGDLMIESVVDEEYGGCNGSLAARLKYNADLAIVPEPTNMIICPAHHGGLMFRVTFEGKSGWSFSPEHPVDPVIALAHFVRLLNDWAAHRQRTLPVPPLYQSNPQLPVLVNQVMAGDVSLPFFADRVPGQAWLTVWAEVYPGASQNEVLDDLHAYYKLAQASDVVLAAFEPEITPIRWLDGSMIASHNPGVQLLAETVSRVTGRAAQVQGAPFACDGHIFNLYSPTPMVLFGAVGGQPHSPDEFVVIDDFLQFVEVLIHTAVQWCGLDSTEVNNS